MVRPSKYSNEIVAEICARLMAGESLIRICRDAEMPDKSNVFRWLADPAKAEFRDQYAQARTIQAELMFDEMLEIMDDGSNDYMERKNKDGSTTAVFNSEHVQRSRLRIDGRKWMLSKMLPKKYGDRATLEHEGAVPITRVVRTIVSPESNSDS